MQKVVGSSPIIRFNKAPLGGCCTKPQRGGFLLPRGSDGSTVGSGGGWRRSVSASSAGRWLRDRRCCRSKTGTPEFEQVVGGCDQLPLRLAGGEAAAEEAVGAADAFRLREDGLDDLLAATVKRLPFRVSTAPPRSAAPLVPGRSEERRVGK